MKLTTQHTKRAKGMTLLELTVVILVLLSLISILFIGARAWKKGSDRAASILTIRNAQQAVRSFSNMNGFNAGETPDTADLSEASLDAEIFGTGKFMETNPTTESHPAGSDYSFAYGAGAGTIPDIGTLYIVTEGGEGVENASDFNPKDSEISDW